MAGRGGPKLKEYRQHITSVRHWLKELEYEGLIMCEVYSSVFGNCQVILPTINNIMLTIDDADQKIKWLVINVAKLEEEQRQLLAEEDKKKAEMENVQRRKAIMENGENGNASGSEPSTPILPPPKSSSILPINDDEDSSAKLKTSWDKITIPKLEKYSGYDHPRPLWLLMKDGVIQYELNSPNPPKMLKLIQSVLSHQPLSDKELSEMDFKPDPVLKKKRALAKQKSKKSRRQEMEEARRAAIEAKKKAKAERPEIQRTPQFIIQARINDIRKPAGGGGDANGNNKHPLLVLYTKESGADDFSYYGQLERQRNETNPIYSKSFAFNKEELAPLFEQDIDMELKFTLYDAESDHISKESPHTLIGETYTTLKTLLGADGEGSATEFKLTRRVAVPHVVDKRGSTRSTARSSARGAHEEKFEDEEMATLSLITKTRVNEGVVTAYRMRISAKGLPTLRADSVGIVGAAEGGDASPSEQAGGRHEYVVELILTDSNTLRGISVGNTDVVRGTADPAFTRPLFAEHYSKDDRQLEFRVYDAFGLPDDVELDYAHDAAAYQQRFIGRAQLKFDAFLIQRKEYRNLLMLSLHDAEGNALLSADGSETTLLVQADELALDGSVEPYEDHLETAFDDGSKQSQQEYIEVAVTIQDLPRTLQGADSSKQPMVALYVQDPDSEEFDKQIGVTERWSLPEGAVDEWHHPTFRKTFLLPKPETPLPPLPQAETSAPTDEDGQPPMSARDSAAPTPRSTTPQQERPAVYKFVIYDSDTDDLSAGNPVVLGESIVKFSHEFLNEVAKDGSHSIDVLDSNNQAHDRTRLHLRLEQVGRIRHLALAFSAAGLIPSEAGVAAGAERPNPFVKVYASHATLGHQLVFVGETKKVDGSDEPTFQTRISVPDYSHFHSTLTVILYDVSGVDGDASELGPSHIIGETSFRLTEFLARSSATGPAGARQPVEFKLFRLTKASAQDAPASPPGPLRQQVNEGKAIIRILDATPKPVRKRIFVNEFGEEEEEEVEEHEAVEESPASAAPAEAASAAATTEATAGTSASAADGSKLALSVSAHELAKSDWHNDKYPFVILYKKSGDGYEYADHSERIRDEADQRWQKLFIIDQPQTSQLYKLVIVDAPSAITNVEQLQAWNQAQELSKPDAAAQQYQAMAGDAEHLGEVVIDVHSLIGHTERVRIQDRYGKEISQTVVQIQGTEVGTIQPVQFNASAADLPNDSAAEKVDPLLVLSARNPHTGVFTELGKTERLVGTSNPTWSTALQMDGWSKMDREVKFSIYHADGDNNVADDHLVGEATASVQALLAVPSVTLKLSKGDQTLDASVTIQATKRGEGRPASAEASAAAAAAAKPSEAQAEEASTAAAATGSTPSSKPSSRPSSKPASRPASAAASARSQHASRPQSAKKSARAEEPSEVKVETTAEAAEEKKEAESDSAESKEEKEEKVATEAAADHPPAATEAAEVAKPATEAAADAGDESYGDDADFAEASTDNAVAATVAASAESGAEAAHAAPPAANATSEPPAAAEATATEPATAAENTATTTTDAGEAATKPAEVAGTTAAE